MLWEHLDVPNRLVEAKMREVGRKTASRGEGNAEDSYLPGIVQTVCSYRDGGNAGRKQRLQFPIVFFFFVCVGSGNGRVEERIREEGGGAEWCCVDRAPSARGQPDIVKRAFSLATPRLGLSRNAEIAIGILAVQPSMGRKRGWDMVVTDWVSPSAGKSVQTAVCVG